MRRLFRRSILWLLPVVVIPLAALVVMQYRTLRALEQKTASAERNWLRNSLEIVAAEIESRYRAEARAALAFGANELADVTRLGDRFAAQSVPGAKTHFVLRFNGEAAEVGYFDARGREKIPTHAEVEAVKLAGVSWHVAHRWPGFVAQTALHVDERDPRNRVVIRPVVDLSMHVAGAVGAVLDETLAHQAMTEVARQAIHERYPHGATSIALRIGESFPRHHGGRHFITQPLGFVFTDWRVGIRHTVATPEEVAAQNFRHNALWTGGAFAVLLLAIALSTGAAWRQMRLSQMKSDFVSNVSHELRTPLSSIRVFGEYMRLGRVTSEEKIREYGGYIEAESRRLTQLINNILDFSKIESSEKQYRFAEADVMALVEQTVEAFAMPLRENGVSVVFTGPPQPPPPMRVDSGAIAQALVNLLDNAVKYSGAAKEVEVTVEVGAGELRIAVRDRGIGIAATEQRKIFEKFYRVGTGLVHDVKGSGLGLSIVDHVVRAHGGRIEVASEPGKGSVFTMILPLSAPAEPLPVSETEYA